MKLTLWVLGILKTFLQGKISQGNNKNTIGRQKEGKKQFAKNIMKTNVSISDCQSSTPFSRTFIEIAMPGHVFFEDFQIKNLKFANFDILSSASVIGYVIPLMVIGESHLTHCDGTTVIGVLYCNIVKFC